MSLDQNINNELKEAMLSKNEVKVRTIKAIKAAFLLIVIAIFIETFNKLQSCSF